MFERACFGLGLIAISSKQTAAQFQHCVAMQLEQFNELTSTFRHSRAGGSPVEFASFNCMPLDSRLRGNDEISDNMENNCLNCTNHCPMFCQIPYPKLRFEAYRVRHIVLQCSSA
jgi:hypothetical protein